MESQDFGMGQLPHGVHEVQEFSLAVQENMITKIFHNGEKFFADEVAVEEPLEIRIQFDQAGQISTKNISVTMRTPGADEKLAIGFLFTEEIIKIDMQPSVVEQLGCNGGQNNVITIVLPSGSVPNLKNMERNFYTTSSCGVCGKSSINAIRTCSTFNGITHIVPIGREFIYALSEKLRKKQQIFSSTGGLHACGFFSLQGELMMLEEDVGRHNALDKLIGKAFINKELPLSEGVLLLSGRASFELLQKAAMAGITIVAALGAPSTLAISLANEFKITLIGFLRDQSFNVYSSTKRII